MPMDSGGRKFEELYSNILLASPLSKRGTEAIDTLDHIFDESNNQVGKDILNKYKDEKNFVETFYIDPLSDENLISQIRDQKISFEAELEKLAKSILILKGVAGCGKTTYIY
jgi:hypothetical protein